MIDENKLMEEVRQWKRKVDKDCGEMPNVSYLTDYISALSVVEGMIAGQPTIEPYGTWIPCDDNTPVKDGKYIVTTAKGSVYCAKGSKYGFHTDMNTHIIAYMPLPEAYKEDSDGKID